MKIISRIGIILIVITLVLISFSIEDVSALDVGVTLNGEPIIFTQDSGHPFLDQSNRTQVPLRITMEAAGCVVNWDNINRVAIVEKDGIVVKIPIGVSYIIVNGSNIPNDTVAVIQNGRTYLPIRAVLEAFGATVTWNSTLKRVEAYTSGVPELTTGTIEYEDGSIYIGGIKNEQPDGIGTMTWLCGDEYTGAWIMGVRTGYGTYTWADGTKYVGNFLNYETNGKGTYYYTDGTIEEGIWLNGEYVSEIDQPPIDPPSIVRIKGEGDVISIGWDQVSGADYYHIYFSYNPSVSWSYFKDGSNNIMAQPWVDTYSCSMTGLAAGMTVYFKIKSVKDGVESEFSSIMEMTTW